MLERLETITPHVFLSFTQVILRPDEADERLCDLGQKASESGEWVDYAQLLAEIFEEKDSAKGYRISHKVLQDQIVKTIFELSSNLAVTSAPASFSLIARLSTIAETNAESIMTDMVDEMISDISEIADIEVDPDRSSPALLGTFAISGVVGDIKRDRKAIASLEAEAAMADDAMAVAMKDKKYSLISELSLKAEKIREEIEARRIAVDDLSDIVADVASGEISDFESLPAHMMARLRDGYCRALPAGRGASPAQPRIDPQDGREDHELLLVEADSNAADPEEDDLDAADLDDDGLGAADDDTDGNDLEDDGVDKDAEPIPKTSSYVVGEMQTTPPRRTDRSCSVQNHSAAYSGWWPRGQAHSASVSSSGSKCPDLPGSLRLGQCSWQAAVEIIAPICDVRGKAGLEQVACPVRELGTIVWPTCGPHLSFRQVRQADSQILAQLGESVLDRFEVDHPVDDDLPASVEQCCSLWPGDVAVVVAAPVGAQTLAPLPRSANAIADAQAQRAARGPDIAPEVGLGGVFQHVLDTAVPGDATVTAP